MRPTAIAVCLALTLALTAVAVSARADCDAQVQRVEARARHASFASPRLKQLLQYDIDSAWREIGEGDEDECTAAVNHAQGLLKLAH